MKGNELIPAYCSCLGSLGHQFHSGTNWSKRHSEGIVQFKDTVFLKKFKAFNLAFELGRLNTNISFFFTCPPVLKVVAKKGVEHR